MRLWRGACVVQHRIGRKMAHVSRLKERTAILDSVTRALFDDYAVVSAAH